MTSSKAITQEEKMYIIVATRFNLHLHFKSNKKEKTDIPNDYYKNEIYLKKRFKLFKQFTLNSMINQSTKPDEWIILLHEETPKGIVAEFERLKNEYSFIQLMFFSDSESDNWVTIFSKYLRKKYNGIILTIRIDNDDAICNTFIQYMSECVIEHAKAYTSCFVSAIHGMQYNTYNDDIIDYHYLENHFLGYYCNSKDKFNNVYCYEHTKIDLGKTISMQSKKPLWMEVLHDSNYGNDIHRRFKELIIPYDIYTYINSSFPNIPCRWTNRYEYYKYIAHEILDSVPIYFRALIKKIKKFFSHN